MPDPHREDRTTLRLPSEVKAGLKAELDAAGWTMHEFWLACAGMLRRRPRSFLADLERFRPGERRGRPPGTPGTRKPATPEGDGPA